MIAWKALVMACFTNIRCCDFVFVLFWKRMSVLERIKPPPWNFWVQVGELCSHPFLYLMVERLLSWCSCLRQSGNAGGWEGLEPTHSVLEGAESVPCLCDSKQCLIMTAWVHIYHGSSLALFIDWIGVTTVKYYFPFCAPSRDYLSLVARLL